MHRFTRPILVCGIACATVVTIHGQEATSLVKPLAKYTIGDLFPPVDAGIEQTAEIWKTASANLHAAATARRNSIVEGLSIIRTRVDDLKANLKAAKKSKNFTAEGTARGAIETEEAVLKILKDLDALSVGQRDVATAWGNVADAMQRYVLADDEFEQYRSQGIAKPLAGGIDSRLDPAGVAAFQKHSKAMDDVGKSFERLGSEIQSLVKDRMQLLSRLEKGGHLMTPPMPGR